MDVEIFPDDAMKEETFRKRVEGDGCFVLTLDGQIIGNLIVTRFGKDEGYLGRIGVVEAHRGKGFGNMLMDYALAWFHKEGGIRTVQLQADLNEAALGLYKKYGFKKAGLFNFRPLQFREEARRRQVLDGKTGRNRTGGQRAGPLRAVQGGPDKPAILRQRRSVR